MLETATIRTKSKYSAKPFVKWAGGKTQILNELIRRLPLHLFYSNKINKYIEPFVGSGALMFHILNNFNIKEVIISDYNKSLIDLYNTIKSDIYTLINNLKQIEKEYKNLTEFERKEFYYEKREKFNKTTDTLQKSVLFIFLNRTCFNGLFRVNSKGEFNVPHGRYKNPKICDEDNLLNVSKTLQNVTIIYGDFEITKKYIDKNSFIYLDPPYRPLNNTSNFTSYSSQFDDKEQIRLKNFIDYINKKKAKFLLSNSDPKNTNPDDNFFDNLYKDYKIERIRAKRMINSNGNKRGEIKEILIRNY